MRRLVTLLCAAALAAPLAGCGGGEGGVTSSRLVGTWYPVEVSEQYGTMPADAAVQAITFAFDGSWRTSDGCSEFTGSYDLADDGTFTGDEKTGSARICGKDGFDGAYILDKADRVRFTECRASLDFAGRQLLVMSLKNCHGTSILGGGLPPSD